MRHTSSVTSVSWIPSEAVTGVALKMPFEVGVAHYDPPPPDVIGDLEEFVESDGCRFANHLSAWIEVQDGVVVDHGASGHGYIGSTTLRVGGKAVTFSAVPLPDRTSVSPRADGSVRFEQTAGGRTGLPAPRRVSHPPYVQLAAPLAWTTLALTLHPDGSAESELVGASPFPRHWIYDAAGRLHSKSAVIDYHTWSTTAFGRHTPWGDEDSPALVSEVESALERQLTAQVMGSGAKVRINRLDAGAVLTEQGAPGEELYVLLDGVLRAEVDGRPVADIGPGALLGERAAMEGNRRTATLRAVTPCTVALASREALESEALGQLADLHRREGQT
ncbi:MAG: cyclic nucleotide-binding domain-containing protein [Actinomycetota bacterium]|nr:cyclic nucleotide-binding domain-containing protein [Actinomycetota bacterium]